MRRRLGHFADHGAHEAGAAWRPAFLLRECVAGVVASLVTLAHCLSFSAVIFSGVLASGLPAGLWGFLAATAAASVIMSLATTLPPALAGPRNPAVAVMSVLAATVAADVLARGGTSNAAVAHVLVALSIATVLTGLALYLLGVFRLGQMVRFIPYPVIGGFLAASGWLLVAGGFKVATGRPLEIAGLNALSGGDFAKLAVAGAFVALVHGLRRVAGAAVLPIVFVAGVVIVDLAAWATGGRAGWFIEGSSSARVWSPVIEAMGGGIEWGVLARASVEIASIVGVSVIALLLDVSSLEVQRQRSADMDAEFRANGFVNLALAPLGAMSVGIALNPSRLADELGARSRIAGVAAGGLSAFVLVSGVDVAAYVPTPLLAGLVIYLGMGVLSEALLKSPAGRATTEMALAVAIMLTIVNFGYLTGVMLGVVGACLLFAVRYARIEAVRRHVTRAQFASLIERDGETAALVVEHGHRIHVFWLTGFVFFGSSNRIYEDVRARVGEDRGGARRWVLLDLSGVTGIDSSALLSFSKLRNWAQSANVTLVLAGASMDLAGQFARANLSRSHLRAFAARSEALEWCEEELIAELGLGARANALADFEAWLAKELGEGAARRLIECHLVRRTLRDGEIVCAQGTAADEIELVAGGAVAVTFTDAEGRSIPVRRMARRTVIGEMGFFRGSVRTATVVAVGETVLFALTREAYARLQREDPLLAQALLELVVRALADRVEFANREIAALI